MATILIVDDNLNIRNYLNTLLQRHGHHLLEAGDVPHALSLCRASKPDLIITDVVMPGADGYDFVRELRCDTTLADTPVIFFTGSYYQEKDARAFAEKCGVAQVLPKPSDPETILAAVDSVLNAPNSAKPVGLPDDFHRAHAQIVADKLFANVIELEEANEHLAASEQHLHRLAERLRSAQEDERTRISRQLHDELGQALTLLKMNCTWISARLTAAPDGVMERLQSSIQLADDAIRNVRRLATELRPGILDLGIAAAIEWQAEEFQRRTEIVCIVDVCEDGSLIDPAVATELFRIFQESLTNIIRHAEASAVEISLTVENNELVLEVRDNGKGISEDDVNGRTTLGLLGMRERAALIGAALSIKGSPAKGTTLRVITPLLVNI